MGKIIVLVTRGKESFADSVQVKLFEDMEDAKKYCKKNKERQWPYWTNVEIIAEDKEYIITSTKNIPYTK